MLQAGDHVAISSHLYGKSQLLLGSECFRLGITSSLVDTCDLSTVASAMTPRTRMIVVETIANPLLQVADIASTAEIAHRNRSLLLVDNTFATPILCRPLVCGANLVLESITKMMNGHSDVMLGLLAGHDRNWAHVPLVVSAWGLAGTPFECWLASRGLATLAVRMERAFSTARRIRGVSGGAAGRRAGRLPGLDPASAACVGAAAAGGQFGSIVTFHLPGGAEAAAASQSAPLNGFRSVRRSGKCRRR